MKNENFKLHNAATSALYILGGNVINLRFLKSGNPLLCFLCYAAAFTVTFTVLFYTLKRVKRAENKFEFICVFAVLLSVIFIVCLFEITISFTDFFKFIKTVILPQNSGFLIFLCTALFIAAITRFCEKAFLKYCLLTFFISAAFIIILFAAGISRFDLSLLEFSALKNEGYGKTVLSACLSAIPFTFYVFSNSNKTGRIYLGSVTGYLMLFICFLQSVLTLSFKSDLNFSYIKAVSVISSGSLFTRLDGIAFFVIAVAVTVKITVCAKSVILTLKNIGTVLKR